VPLTRESQLQNCWWYESTWRVLSESRWRKRSKKGQGNTSRAVYVQVCLVSKWI